MKVFDNQSRIIITCNKRVSAYLKDEVEALGFTVDRQFATGLELKGTVNDCIRLNLNLCCASQVLYSLKTFYANSPEDVYSKLVAMPWETLIPNDGYLTCKSHVDHFTVNTPLFVNVRMKDAIADRMTRETGRRPDSGPASDHTVIHLYWKETDAEVFIDTTGVTLGKHGYRKIPGKAPMLESLAASTLRATSWDRKSPFVNPMCGSGTVAIEAALWATNRKPGLLRDNYGFMHLIGFDRTIYESECHLLEKQVIDVPGLKIIATDISEDAIEVSHINATAAGVIDYIEFKVCDFQETPLPQEAGVVYFNPEYGERLGDIEELEETYALLGDYLKKKCKGYIGYIFTGNLDLAKKIGLKAKRRIEFFNSHIDCRLLEYELYDGSRKKEKVQGENPTD